MWHNRKAIIAALKSISSHHRVDLDYGVFVLSVAAAAEAADILRAHGLAIASTPNGWSAIEIMPTWFHRTAKAHAFWSGADHGDGLFKIRYARLIDPKEIADAQNAAGWYARTRKTETGLVVTWRNGSDEHVFEIANRYRRAA